MKYTPVGALGCVPVVLDDGLIGRCRHPVLRIIAVGKPFLPRGRHPVRIEHTIEILEVIVHVVVQGIFVALGNSLLDASIVPEDF